MRGRDWLVGLHGVRTYRGGDLESETRRCFVGGRNASGRPAWQPSVKEVETCIKNKKIGIRIRLLQLQLARNEMIKNIKTQA